MQTCHSSLYRPKRRIVVLVIVKESFLLRCWAFEYFRFGNFASVKRSHFNGVRAVLPIMLSTRRCTLGWNTGGLFTSFRISVLLLSSCFCFGKKKKKMRWIISARSVADRFHVSRITPINIFPFGTKLQRHPSVRGGGLDQKVVNHTATLPRPTARLSFNTLSVPFFHSFPPCLSNRLSLIFCFYIKYLDHSKGFKIRASRSLHGIWLWRGKGNK